jgi:serine protease Do
MAGLVPGDIITRIDGKPISDARSLQKTVAESDAGRVLAVSLIRRGAVQQLSLRVSARPEEGGLQQVQRVRRDGRFDQLLGVNATPLTPQSRSQQGLGTSVDGLLVAEVVAGSPGAEADLRVDDLVLQIDQRPVSTLQQFRSSIQKARADNRRAILVTMLRGGELMFKALRLGNPKVDTAQAGVVR